MKCLVPAFCLVLLAALPARAQIAPACTSGAPILRPIMATPGLPPYPPMAVPLDEEGVSLLTVTIGVDGVPVDVAVTATSGSTRLDNAAADYVKAVWKWQPPLGPNCDHVRAVTRVSVNWSLSERDHPPARFTALYMEPRDYPAGALERKEQGSVSLIVKMAADGKPAFVIIKDSSGFPELDAKATDIVRSHYRSKPGEAVPGDTGVIAVWTLPLPDKK